MTQYGIFLRPSALATQVDCGGSGGGGSDAGIGTGAPAAGAAAALATAGAFAAWVGASVGASAGTSPPRARFASRERLSRCSGISVNVAPTF